MSSHSSFALLDLKNLPVEFINLGRLVQQFLASGSFGRSLAAALIWVVTPAVVIEAIDIVERIDLAHDLGNVFVHVARKHAGLEQSWFFGIVLHGAITVAHRPLWVLRQCILPIGTNGNAYYARIESPREIHSHPLLAGFIDTNWLPGAQNRVPLKPVPEPLLTVVPGLVHYPPELAYPSVSHTGELILDSACRRL